MKRVVHWSGNLVLGVLLVLVWACQDDVPKSQSAVSQQKESQMAQHLTEAEKRAFQQSASRNQEIVGPVAGTSDGFAIITDEEEYTVANTPPIQDPDKMVGKRVKVTATPIEDVGNQEGNRVIDAIELTEIDE